MRENHSHGSEGGEDGVLLYPYIPRVIEGAGSAGWQGSAEYLGLPQTGRCNHWHRAAGRAGGYGAFAAGAALGAAATTSAIVVAGVTATAIP